jgi:hypothetical protein
MVLTAIHGEGDGLVLCEVMTALILVMLVLVLLELTQQVPSKRCCGVFSAISSSQHHVRVFPLLLERQQKLRMQIVYNGLPKFFGRLLYAYLHPLLGADES